MIAAKSIVDFKKYGVGAVVFKSTVDFPATIDFKNLR